MMSAGPRLVGRAVGVPAEDSSLVAEMVRVLMTSAPPINTIRARPKPNTVRRLAVMCAMNVIMLRRCFARLTPEIAVYDLLPDRAGLPIFANNTPQVIVRHRAVHRPARLRPIVQVKQECQPYKAPFLHFGNGCIGEISLIGKGIIAGKLKAFKGRVGQAFGA